MKYFLLGFLLIFTACTEDISVSDSCNYVNCDLPISDTDSVPPVDNITTKPELRTQSLTYLESYKTGSKFYDSYGLLMPIGSNGSFIHHGDALIWNAIALSTMCILQNNVNVGKLDSAYDVSTELDALWNAFKTNLILSSGTIIRHPDSTSNTSISRDAISGFLFLGAVAQEYNCITVTQDYGAHLSNFIAYGKANDWDFATSSAMSKPSTTVLNDRHMLKAAANIYKLTSDVDYTTSISNHKENLRMMDILYESRHLCRLGYPDACLRGGNSAVYPTHLTFLTNFIFYVDAKKSNVPVHTLSKIKEWSVYVGRVGGSISLYNWLYVVQYRVINNNTSNNDVAYNLQTIFPDTPPKENNPTVYGCDEYIWQRVPLNRCNGSSTQYVGTDYLLVFALVNGI